MLAAGDLGVDFSLARPALAGSGAKYAIRYSAGAGMASNPATHPKLITPSEFGALVLDGCDVIANSEWYESRVTEGAIAGHADGAADLVLWRLCGLAKGAAIYVSWDAMPDVTKWVAVDAYLRAYRMSLGGYYRVGIYAGTPYLKHALAAGLADYGWRPNAGAWSNDGLPYQPNTSTPAKRAALVAHAREVTPAHIWQTGNYWWGQSADENLILRTPVGSHRDAIGAATVTQTPPKPPAKPSDLPKIGPLAVEWTNPHSGVKRSAAGWIEHIVEQNNQILAELTVIRAAQQSK